jgi:hypothetical protein
MVDLSLESFLILGFRLIFWLIDTIYEFIKMYRVFYGFSRQNELKIWFLSKQTPTLIF